MTYRRIDRETTLRVRRWNASVPIWKRRERVSRIGKEDVRKELGNNDVELRVRAYQKRVRKVKTILLLKSRFLLFYNEMFTACYRGIAVRLYAADCIAVWLMGHADGRFATTGLAGPLERRISCESTVVMNYGCCFVGGFAEPSPVRSGSVDRTKTPPSSSVLEAAERQTAQLVFDSTYVTTRVWLENSGKSFQTVISGTNHKSLLFCVVFILNNYWKSQRIKCYLPYTFVGSTWTTVV